MPNSIEQARAAAQAALELEGRIRRFTWDCECGDAALELPNGPCPACGSGNPRERVYFNPKNPLNGICRYYQFVLDVCVAVEGCQACGGAGAIRNWQAFRDLACYCAPYRAALERLNGGGK